MLRGGRGRRVRPRRRRPGPARPRPDAVRRPHPGVPRRPGVQAADRRRGAVRPLGRRRLLPAQPRRGRAGGARRPGRAPGDARPDQGRPGHGAQADGQRRARAHVLDGRRLAAAQPRPPVAAGGPLPAPAIRPGHEPADRPAAGAAGDEPANGPRPSPAAPGRVGRGGRAAPAPLVLPVPGGHRQPGADRPGAVAGHPARRHLPGEGRPRGAVGRGGPADRRGRGRGRGRRRHAGDRLRRRRPRPGAGPHADRLRGGPPGALRAAAALAHRAGGRGRRRVRRARLRRPARLRGRRDLPPPGAGHRGGRGRPGRRRRPHQPGGAGPLPGRGRGRGAQDPVQDGHLHGRLLPGRADLRGGRPRPRGRRGVLHRHAQRRGRHRLAGAG